MNRLKHRLIFWVPFLIIAGISIYYARSKGSVTIHGQTMGTTYSVKIVYQGSKPDSDFIKKRIDTILVDFNQSLSTYIPESEISKFNKSDNSSWFKVSNYFYDIVKSSKELNKITKHFDPTVGPAINLWGFGEAGVWNNPPKDSELVKLKKYVGFEFIELHPSEYKIKKLHPKTSINLSAIAKGYGVDVVSNFLESIKAKNYLVEIGGEIRTRGSREDGTPWKLGIETPSNESDSEKSIQKIINVGSLSLATSGNYRNYFEKDGVRYSHIISPMTLKPVTHNTASVSVVHESCGLADGWATALLALEPKEALNLAEKHKIAAFFITHNNGRFDTFGTSEFDKLF